MPRLNDIFHLVGRMSNGEKRIFTAYTGRGTDYWKLYDIINRSRNLAIAINRTNNWQKRNNRSAGAYAMMLSDLYKKLLQSLAMRNNSIEEEITSNLSYIKILYDRELYTQAIDIVKIAKKLVFDYEEFDYASKISSWEKNIYCLDKAQFTRIVAEEKNTLAILDNLNDCWSLHYEILAEITLHGANFNVQTISNFVSTNQQIRALSTKAEILQEYNYLLLYFLTCSYHDSYIHGKKLVSIIRKHQEKISTNYRRPLNQSSIYEIEEHAIHNLIISCIVLSKFNEGSAYLERIKNDGINWPLLKDYLWSRAGMNKALIETLSDEETKSMDYHQKQMYYIIAATAHIHIQDFKLADDWLKKMNNFKTGDIRTDLFCIWRLLDLLIYWETEVDNTFLKEVLCPQVKRKLIGIKRYFAFEQEFIQTVQKLANTKKKSNQTLIFQDFLNYINKTKNTTATQNMLKEFEFDIWCKSHLQNKPMNDLQKKIEDS